MYIFTRKIIYTFITVLFASFFAPQCLIAYPAIGNTHEAVDLAHDLIYHHQPVTLYPLDGANMGKRCWHFSDVPTSRDGARDGFFDAQDSGNRCFGRFRCFCLGRGRGGQWRGSYAAGERKDYCQRNECVL